MVVLVKVSMITPSPLGPWKVLYDGGPGYLIINEFYPHNGQRIYNNG